jgi:hypothetical protein
MSTAATMQQSGLQLLIDSLAHCHSLSFHCHSIKNSTTTARAKLSCCCTMLYKVQTPGRNIHGVELPLGSLAFCKLAAADCQASYEALKACWCAACSSHKPPSLRDRGQAQSHHHHHHSSRMPRTLQTSYHRCAGGEPHQSLSRTGLSKKILCKHDSTLRLPDNCVSFLSLEQAPLCSTDKTAFISTMAATALLPRAGGLGER